MRDRFNEQLIILNKELEGMGLLCVKAISCAIKAFADNDESLIDVAIADEKEIDDKENEIEAMCVKLLLQQQPVAKDLRIITAALKMISDMERIGDQASDIAEIAHHIIGRDNESETHLKEMAMEAVKMVDDSIHSFINTDTEEARQVIAHDDVVDQLFNSIREDLVELLQKSPEDSAYYLDLMMIAKYLERIGDHATNIAEWVVYSITGIHENNEHHY